MKTANPKSARWIWQAGDPGESQCFSSSSKADCWQNSFLFRGGPSSIKNFN